MKRTGSQDSRRVRFPAWMRQPPPAATPTPFAFPAAQRFRLANGLRVLLVERHELPLVRIQLVLLHGTAQDPSALPGVTYTTAAMVDEGAGGRDALQIATEVAALGSSLATHVDEDTTALTMELLCGHLKRGLDLLAEVVRGPRLAAADLARVKEEVRHRALEQRGRPDEVAAQCLRAAIFGAHPYGRPVVPRAEAVDRLRVSHLRQLHRASYRPDNAVVVAAGAVAREELRELLEARLGSWRAGTGPRRRMARPPSSGPRLVAVDRPGASETILRVGHLAPRRPTRQHAAIEVINTALGGSFTSRLNQNLRENHGFTYGVASSFNLMRHGGIFSIHTSVETGATRAALVEIFKEIRATIDGGLTRDELVKSGRLVLEELPGNAETLGGIVDVHSIQTIYNHAVDALNRMPREIGELEPDGIRALAGKVLRPKDATIVLAGDLDRILDGVEQEFGPAERWGADALPLRR